MRNYGPGLPNSPFYTFVNRPTVAKEGDFITLSDMDYSDSYYKAGAWHMKELQQLGHSVADVTVDGSVVGLNETIVNSFLLPAKMWLIGDTLVPLVSCQKTTAGANSYSIRYRLGIVGDITDTQVYSASITSNVPINGGNIHSGLVYKSSTLIDFLNINNSNTSFVVPGVIPDPSLNDLYLITTIQLTNVTDIVTIRQHQIIIY